MMSNRKLWSAWGFLLAFLMAGQVLAFIGKDKVWRHNLPDAEAEAKQLGRPILLHFHASWCGPCRQMDADVLNTGDVKRILLERVIGVKVDLDQHPEIADKYGVDKIPADVLVTPEGKMLKKHIGFQQRDAYIGMLLGAERSYLQTRPQPQIAKTEQAPVQDPIQTLPLNAGGPTPPDAANLKPRTEVAQPADVVVAMEGYCPVTLWRTRQWVRGKTAFGADYQGLRYYFTTLEDRDDFIAEPTRYAPQLLGCDPVALWDSERAIAGTSKFAAYFDGELYLFSSSGNRERFKSSPPTFTKTRHVKLEDIERADTRIGMKN